ncbi:MAG: hypothetical protein WC501_01875 [Candidatus Micrarchaeia archaeon]
MSELKRHIRCSNCKNESEFLLSSNLVFDEVSISGKCPHCSSSIQINFNVIEQGISETAKTTEEPSKGLDLEEDFFGKDLLGNVGNSDIKDIIEDEGY